MQDDLVKIKRSLLEGRYYFSEKARNEMEADGLTELDVVESILNAVAIYKKVRSTSPFRRSKRENLYIIQGTNFEGLMVYSKGKWIKKGEIEKYYFLISCKKSLE